MGIKEFFLTLTKEQKEKGRVYLTDGQLNFLKGKISQDVEPIIIEPPTIPQQPSVYDDSKDLFTFCYKLPLLLVYQIKSYCATNNIAYKDFFNDLLLTHPAKDIKPDPTKTIKDQLRGKFKYRNTNTEMAQKGFIDSLKASEMIGLGVGSASRACVKGLKHVRVGRLLYFKPEDVAQYVSKMNKKRS